MKNVHIYIVTECYNLRRKLLTAASGNKYSDMVKQKFSEIADVLVISSKIEMEISQIEKDKPSLLHGRAASVVLKNEFGVTNKDVLEAVANHTFGKPKMCNLAKILYVSDKIEPGRPQVTQEYLEKIEKKSLNELLSFVLEENIDYLNKKGKSVSEITYKFLESVKEGEC